MATAQRSAQCTWNGDLAHGKGMVDGASGAFTELPVTWASRTERSAGQTSPEELIAAAHASCFSMALAHELSQGGNVPDQLEVTARVTLDERDGAPTVTTSEITVEGRVPGVDQEAFTKAATNAGEQCPVSRALGGVEISVQATLSS